MSVSRTTYLDLMIGPHKVIRKLGEGGMGSVWEAENIAIGRHVAVKFLHPEYARDETHLRRFFNEARAANAIEHPGIVQIFDTGMLDAETPYLLMELLRGQSLDAVIAEQRTGMTQQEALAIVWQVADVLVMMHARGIVHRDLKPGNIMLIQDPLALGGRRVKILDLGLAKLRPDQKRGAEATRVGCVMGTPIYMAPEQCLDSTTVNGQADVYALGVVLFELLAGQPPFLTANQADILRMHLFAEVPDLLRLAPHVSAPVAEIVRWMLQKEVSQRPTMAQVHEHLSRLIAGAPGLAQAGVKHEDDTVLIRREAEPQRSVSELWDTEPEVTRIVPIPNTRLMWSRSRQSLEVLSTELTGAFRRLTPAPLPPPATVPKRGSNRVADALGLFLCIVSSLLCIG